MAEPLDCLPPIPADDRERFAQDSAYNRSIAQGQLEAARRRLNCCGIPLARDILKILNGYFSLTFPEGGRPADRPIQRAYKEITSLFAYQNHPMLTNVSQEYPAGRRLFKQDHYAQCYFQLRQVPPERKLKGVTGFQPLVIFRISGKIAEKDEDALGDFLDFMGIQPDLIHPLVTKLTSTKGQKLFVYRPGQGLVLEASLNDKKLILNSPAFTRDTEITTNNPAAAMDQLEQLLTYCPPPAGEFDPEALFAQKSSTDAKTPIPEEVLLTLEEV